MADYLGEKTTAWTTNRSNRKVGYRILGLHPLTTLIILSGAAIMAVAILITPTVGASPSRINPDWQRDWAVQSGFEVEVDSEGFQFPTSIAFVPNPGSSPKDPLYFVTELLGSIKVVTNDRTVFTFAADLLQPVSDQKTSLRAGMGAICLDAKHGFVFTTFIRPDQNGILRNNIVRFQSEPGTFSLEFISKVEITPLLQSFTASEEHQIGACQVEDDLIYVGVGDGSQTEQSQQLDSVLGKILRMTLDGDPAPGNPFAIDEDPEKAVNFVWASGFRNPFGLKLLDGRLFVADNGPAVDRFMRVTSGDNYLWDGSDFSIGTNAGAVLSPGKGVAQMDHYPVGSLLFPDRFHDSFFMSVTGSPSQQLEGIPAVLELSYDLAQNSVASVPKALVRYRGGGVQVVAGLGFGPDGLYFLPMMPDKSGASAVLKIRHKPASEYPHFLETESNPIALMNANGCFACHSLNNNAGGIVGPILDREFLVPRVLGRLESQEYPSQLEELDRLEEEPFASFRQARQEVAEAEGMEKVALWLQYRIQEPKFDDLFAQMPNLGINPEQARIIAAHLAGTQLQDQDEAEQTGFFLDILNGVRGMFPSATRANAKSYAAAIFGLGLFVGLSAAVGVSYFVDRRRRRRSGS